MKKLFLAVLVVLGFSFSLHAETTVNLTAVDKPNDGGDAILLSWDKELNTVPGAEKAAIYRGSSKDGEFEKIKDIDLFSKSYGDNTVKDGENYFYYISAYNGSAKEIMKTTVVGPVVSKPQLFDTKKTMSLIFTLVTFIIILVFIFIARTGRKLYVRPLAGVKAIEEAIGRATEMGKPAIYVPGISVIDDIATLASISILSKVAEVVAQYNSKIVVPNYDPIVYSVIDDVVKNAYIKVGRPDAYNPDDVYYLTGRQFAFASAVSGLMAREKPAANFFLGMFYAESLLLAEAGSMTGAIQIAGTDSVTQIPFFITACDYTLIGEELYAAGAYMGDNKQLLGGLKGQDYSKLLFMAVLVILFLLKLFGVSGVETFLVGEGG